MSSFDLLKVDQTETDTQEHIEIITLESSTKDMSEIIKVIEPVMEVTTEDGYTGTLGPRTTPPFRSKPAATRTEAAR